MNEEIAPNRDRLDQLKCGGLGKKRITFNKDGDHAYFIKKLEEEFPKLQLQQGAIEVLRSSTGGSGARPLTPIPLGSQGYCIQELRASLNSATLFVRPLQTDLELDQVVQVTRETPKVTCIHCGKEVNLCELRVHCQSLECTLARTGTSAQTVDTEGNRDDSSRSPLSRCTVDLTSDETVAETVGDLMPLSSSHWGSTASLSGKLEVLRDMFPQVELDRLSKVAASSFSLDDAIDELVNCSPEQSNKTLVQVLTEFRSQVKPEEEINITVERDNIWCNVLAFYKKSDKERLRKKLVVAFEGEDGVDAGALAAEFFQLALDQVKKRLFQGKPERVLPIKDSTKAHLFFIAGVIVAHSLLQNGPSFPCLCPALYDYLVGRRDDVPIHVRNDDIPLTADTEAVLDLIKQLDDCETATDLSSCLSDDRLWGVISASHWPNEVCITLQNKGKI